MREVAVECVPDFEVLGRLDFVATNLKEMKHLKRGDYTVTMASNWYYPVTKRLKVGREDMIFDVDLNYKEVADGNFDEVDIGEWQSVAELVLDGGVG